MCGWVETKRAERQNRQPSKAERSAQDSSSRRTCAWEEEEAHGFNRQPLQPAPTAPAPSDERGIKEGPSNMKQQRSGQERR
ncbi:unnamed protein product [Boreogadus saida]